MSDLIQKQISLRDKNWFKVGGPARYYAEPTTEQEFQQALLFAKEQELPIFVLGQGANILISDEGFDGLVIRPGTKQPLSRPTGTTVSESSESWGIRHIMVSGSAVTASAGVTMHDLIDYCLDHNLGGLEEFSGIPGTVGGSVYINLHYFEFLLAQFLVSARVINKSTAEIIDVTPDWFQFGYDQSTLMNHEYYLLSATFKLTQLTPEQTMYARGRRHEIIRHRARRYPTSNTCGSFFRNFHDEEVTLVSSGKKMTFVAYYLDKLGVKGALQVGDARVSWQHANMLVTGPNATAQDVINLARKMQELCWNTFGVLPQPECQLIGFKEYPLHDSLIKRTTIPSASSARLG